MESSPPAPFFEANGFEDYPVPKFPTLLDSTTISAWKKCHRAGYYEFFIRRVATGTNPHLNAGGAYAAGHEVFRKTFYGQSASEDEAKAKGLRKLIETYGPFEPADDDKPQVKAKTWDRVATAFLTYYEEYPPQKDYLVPVFTYDKFGDFAPMVEFSFAQPIDIAHPQTGEPILLGGKADGIMWLDRGGWRGDGKLHVGKPMFVYDDKTTYQMGITWADQWKLRSQFRCYTWAARENGYNVSGTIIRGAGIQKTDIKHVDAIVMYPPWQIDEWFAITRRRIKEMVECWNQMMNDFHGDPETLANAFEKDLDGACTMYGGCMFAPLCVGNRHSRWVNTGFIERTWSPIEEESL